MESDSLICTLLGILISRIINDIPRIISNFQAIFIVLDSEELILKVQCILHLKKNNCQVKLTSLQVKSWLNLPQAYPNHFHVMAHREHNFVAHQGKRMRLLVVRRTSLGRSGLSRSHLAGQSYEWITISLHTCQPQVV